MFVQHLNLEKIEEYIEKNFIQKGNAKKFSSVKDLANFANENSCRLTYGMQAYAIEFKNNDNSSEPTAKLISYGGIDPKGISPMEPTAKITTLSFSDFNVKIDCDGVAYSQADYEKFQREWVKLNAETFDKNNTSKPYMQAYKANINSVVNNLFAKDSEITK